MAAAHDASLSDADSCLIQWLVVALHGNFGHASELLGRRPILNSIVITSHALLTHRPCT